MQARLHWLRLTLPEASRPALEGLVRHVWGDMELQTLPGLWRYERRSQWHSGVRLYYCVSQEARKRQGYTVCLDVPGKALDCLEVSKLRSLLFRCEEYGAKPSRLDVNLDDFQRIVEPGALEEPFVQGAVVGFRTFGRKWRRGGPERALCHDETNFGQRGGRGCGKYLRVYDKRLESDGENEAVRWELELTNDGRSLKAEVAWNALLAALDADETGDEFGAACAKLVVSAIDFREPRDPATDRHVKRRTRLPWWQTLVDRAGGRVKLGKRCDPPGIDERREWLETQTTRNLAIVGEVAERLGETWEGLLAKLRSLGIARIRPADRVMIENYLASDKRGPPPDSS